MGVVKAPRERSYRHDSFLQSLQERSKINGTPYKRRRRVV